MDPSVNTNALLYYVTLPSTLDVLPLLVSALAQPQAASSSKHTPEKKKEEAVPVVQKEVKKEEKKEESFSLFDDDENDEEYEKQLEERRKAAEIAKGGAKKKDVIAKSMVILDVKPWDDETPLDKVEECVRSITMEGLIWGTSKLVPVAYQIKKLQIGCVVEDDKVSVDDLEEKILSFSDYVQSMDVAAFNKL